MYQDDYSINGYERTDELALIETMLNYNDELMYKQREIRAWCRVSRYEFPPIPKLQAEFAQEYPDTLKFINECEQKAFKEYQRLCDERKSLLLKLEAVKARTPYKPEIPFKK